jgi:hypothetical protein
VPAEELTAAPDTPDRTTGRPDTRRPRASLWALRVSALLHTATIAAQPVLAGRFLAGDVDAIAMHEINSHLVTTIGWVQIIAAIAYVWRGRGRAWPLWLSIVLALCEETQKVLGYFRLADLHIPFGVVLILAQVLLTIWLFGSAARRTRPAKEPTS